jgi:hypothetical protein
MVFQNPPSDEEALLPNAIAPPTKAAPPIRLNAFDQNHGLSSFVCSFSF